MLNKMVAVLLFIALLLIFKWLPKVFFHIGDITIIVDIYSVRAQHVGLNVYSTKSERRRASSKPIDNSITWHVVGIGIEMQGIPHRSRRARRSAQRGDLPVCRDLSFRYLLHLFVYNVVKTHIPIIVVILYPQTKSQLLDFFSTY